MLCYAMLSYANHDFALKLAQLIDDIVFYTSAKVKIEILN